MCVLMACSNSSRRCPGQSRCIVSSRRALSTWAPCPHTRHAPHCSHRAVRRQQYLPYPKQHCRHGAVDTSSRAAGTAGNHRARQWHQPQQWQEWPAARNPARALNQLIISTRNFQHLISILHQHHDELRQQGTPNHVLDAVNLSALASQLAKASRWSSSDSNSSKSQIPRQAQLLQVTSQLADLCLARTVEMRPRQLSSCLWALSVLAGATGLFLHVQHKHTASSQEAARSMLASQSNDSYDGHTIQVVAAEQQPGLEFSVFQALADDVQLQGSPPKLDLDSGMAQNSAGKQQGWTHSAPAAHGKTHDNGSMCKEAANTCAAKVYRCMTVLVTELASSRWPRPVSARDISQALHAFAHLRVPLPNAHVAAALLQGLERQATACSAQDCSLAVWSIAVLQLQPVPVSLLQSIEQASIPMLKQEFTSQGLSNMAWGLAVLQHTPSSLWTAHLLHASCNAMQRCTHQELAMLSWAVPQLIASQQRQSLQQHVQQWLQCLEAELVWRLSTATDHNKAGMQLLPPLPEVAVDQDNQLSQRNAEQADIAKDSAALKRELLQPQHVACALRCMTLLQHMPSAAFLPALRAHLLAALARPYQQPTARPACLIASASPPPVVGPALPTASLVPARVQLWATDMHAQCTVLWCLARMAGYGAMGSAPPADLVACLVHSMGLLLHECNAQDLSSALYALALVGHQPNTKWLVRFFTASRQLMSSCGPAQLAALLLGLARLQVRPDKQWMDHALSEVSGHVAACLSGQNTGSSSSGGSSSSSNGGGGSSGFSNRKGKNNRSDHSLARVVLQSWQCGPRAVASLWGALGRLGYCPPASCTGPLFAVTFAQLPAFNAAELTMMLTAQAKMGLRLSRQTGPTRATAAAAGIGNYSHEQKPAPDIVSSSCAVQVEDALQRDHNSAVLQGSHPLSSQRQDAGLQQVSVVQQQADKDVIPAAWAPAVCHAVARHAASMPPQHLHAVLSALHTMRLMSGFATLSSYVHSTQVTDGLAMVNSRGSAFADQLAPSRQFSVGEQKAGEQSMQEQQLLELYSLASLSLLAPPHVRVHRRYNLRAQTSQTS